MVKVKKHEGQIEHIPTAELVPYARNSRTHSDEQIAQIAASIREFGFCNPVLIDAEGTIIAGHGRVMAATRMKLETVPCLRLSHLTDAQKRAYVIADNQIATNANWDVALLQEELDGLLSECEISEADLRHMFSNMQSIIGSPVEEEQNQDTRQSPVEAMELRPHEHYDFIVVLARDAMTWNNLCAELGMTSQPLFGRKNTKYGISRAITAEKVLERIQNNNPQSKTIEGDSA
jgi:hypothetical protein